MEIIVFPQWMQWPVLFVAMIGFTSCLLVAGVLLWAVYDKRREERKHNKRLSRLPYGGF